MSTVIGCVLAVVDVATDAAVRARAEQAEASAAAMREALDLAWGLIANANGGDWTLATPEWRAAAERWRDEHYSKRDTDAGSQMLERVRRAEAGPACPSCGAATRPDIHICHSCLDAWVGGKGCEWLDRALAPYKERAANHAARLLRAAQSLHRAWRRERDVRETLVQQYRAQHDAEARRRGCPFCTCDVCAAAMRRTVVSERDLLRVRVACAADLLAEERNRLRGQSESWRRAAVAWQEWAARLTGDAALGDEAARAAVSGRVAELEEALRGLVEAAQVLASSHAEMHDNAILLETVDEPADRAICAARAALEARP